MVFIGTAGGLMTGRSRREFAREITGKASKN